MSVINLPSHCYFKKNGLSWLWRILFVVSLNGYGLAHADCTIQPHIASSTNELNNAIACFNAVTTAGTYTIKVVDDITLNTASTPIDNTNDGVKLQVEGDNFVLDGGNSERGFTIKRDTHVTIKALTISNGNADGSGDNARGGGIYNEGALTINNGTLSDNEARYGGGLYNEGTLTITNGSFLNNIANYHGGGIYSDETLTVMNSTFTNNRAENEDGGGIHNKGTLNVMNSIFEGNYAYGDESTGGGGIYNRDQLAVSNSAFINNTSGGEGGGILNTGVLTVTNSTLANNAAGNPNDGGGIYNGFGSSGAAATLRHVTLYGNRGGGVNGSTNKSRPNTITLYNSIIANSLSLDGAVSAVNCSGSTISADSGNLATDNSCDNSGEVADVKLAPLADNNSTVMAGSNVGGSTPSVVQTMALLTDSPAIDTGSAACGVSTDQRGISRPQGGKCDIGAFELISSVQNEIPVSTSIAGGSVVTTSFTENTSKVRQIVANGENLNFSIAGGADAELFSIDERGRLHFLNAPDFEQPLDGDGDNQYEVIVEVSGSNGSDRQAIRIQVTDVEGLKDSTPAARQFTSIDMTERGVTAHGGLNWLDLPLTMHLGQIESCLLDVDTTSIYLCSQMEFLYVALLGRTFDAPGLAYWLNQAVLGLQDGADRNTVMAEIVGNFLRSEEFKTILEQSNLTYRNDTINYTALLNYMYREVGREKDEAGFNFWLDFAEQEGLEQLITAFSYSTVDPEDGGEADSDYVLARMILEVQFLQALAEQGILPDAIRLKAVKQFLLEQREAVLDDNLTIQDLLEVQPR